MARVRMVTRTIDVTVAEVMCVDVTTASVKIMTYELNGLYENNQKIMDEINKGPANIKAVAVQKVEKKEVLYGMTETDFIKFAKVLPPRAGKDE